MGRAVLCQVLVVSDVRHVGEIAIPFIRLFSAASQQVRLVLQFYDAHGGFLIYFLHDSVLLSFNDYLTSVIDIDAASRGLVR